MKRVIKRLSKIAINTKYHLWFNDRCKIKLLALDPYNNYNSTALLRHLLIPEYRKFKLTPSPHPYCNFAHTIFYYVCSTSIILLAVNLSSAFIFRKFIYATYINQTNYSNGAIFVIVYENNTTVKRRRISSRK